MMGSPEQSRRVTKIGATALAFALLGFVLAGYLLVAASSQLWDRDEPRFARAAVEMVGSGDYLVPTFNGELRPDKPILIYWLMSVPLRLLGPTELAVRLPSVLGTAAACWLTFLIGRRMFDRRTGLWAMIILATSTLTFIVGTAATADGTLLAFVTLGFWAFVETVLTRPRWWLDVVMAVAVGGAQLAKGPVGLAIIVLSVVTAAVLGRREFHLGRRFWTGFAVAPLTGIGLFLLWAIPANAATGGEFAARGLGHHVWNRMLTPQEGHGASGGLMYLTTLPVYLLVIAIGFLPWTFSLPVALGSDAMTATPRSHRAILWGWMLATFLLMTLVVTKLPHYILPIFPALALTTAAAIQRRQQAALVQARSERHPVRLAVVFSVAVLLVCLLLVPRLEPRLKASRDLAYFLADRGDENTDVVVRGFEEPSLMFYLNRPAARPIRRLAGNDVTAWVVRPEPGVLITTARQWEQDQRRFGPMQLAPLWHRDIFNYPSGKNVRVVALTRSMASTAGE
jgi:4-amino-4-deoxy-L-arabinose transferase-like glycosyltransferase